jgi:hypothetical protein
MFTVALIFVLWLTAGLSLHTGSNLQFLSLQHVLPSVFDFTDAAAGPSMEVNVIIILDAPPASGVSSASASVIEQQEVLIAALEAAPFNAQIIGTTQIALNSILARVDQRLVPALRALPGVQSVQIERVFTID